MKNKYNVRVKFFDCLRKLLLLLLLSIWAKKSIQRQNKNGQYKKKL